MPDTSSHFNIPIIATQAGIIVGSTVFTIVSKTGQATTFVLKHGTNLAALAVGAGIEAFGDPLTALLTRQTISYAGETYITPAAETTSQSAAFAAAAVSGVATTLIMTIAIVGGKAVIEKIKESGSRRLIADTTQQVLPTYVAYELKESDDFTEIISLAPPYESQASVPNESDICPRIADSHGELELPPSSCFRDAETD